MLYPQKKFIFKTLILAGLITGFFSNETTAQSAIPPRPKLILGIMVEGLNEDNISMLRPLFTKDGFNRFYNDGVILTNVDFGSKISNASAAAIVYTGASPVTNGIFANEKFDRRTNRISHILRDTTYIGNTSTQILSPKAITVSTLGDEVRLDASGTGWVYSIAPDASQAIISAGHAGSNAYWIDDNTGLWTTTAYYKDIPAPMSNRNFRRSLPTMLDTLTWKPLLKPELYPYIPEYKIKYPFRYNFTKKDSDRFIHFKQSGRVNDEITDLACEFLKNMDFGNRGTIDMLNLTFNVNPYPFPINADNRMELMDSYLRLDNDLSILINEAEKKVGKENLLVFISGIPARRQSVRDDDKWGIPSGDFSPKKAVSLLNMYLMALHGNGNWVTGYFDRNFYLNLDLIKDKQLDLSSIRKEAAEFLTRMSGVSSAITVEDIIAGRAGDNPTALKRNSSIKHSGDITIEIIPGWSVVDDINLQADKTPQVFRENISPSTVMFYSPLLEPQIIETRIDARVIAPTVARLAKIRAPNAAELPPLRL